VYISQSVGEKQERMDVNTYFWAGLGSMTDESVLQVLGGKFARHQSVLYLRDRRKEYVLLQDSALPNE
jgi:hypothetical protein